MPGTAKRWIDTSPPPCVPSGTTSTVTSSGLAAITACTASPMFSLPSEKSTSRFWPVSGNAAVPRRMAPAISVRSAPTTVWMVLVCRAIGVRDNSMPASVPNTIKPALSVDCFSAEASSMWAVPCSEGGTLCERSSRK